MRSIVPVKKEVAAVEVTKEAINEDAFSSTAQLL